MLTPSILRGGNRAANEMRLLQQVTTELGVTYPTDSKLSLPYYFSSLNLPQIRKRYSHDRVVSIH